MKSLNREICGRYMLITAGPGTDGMVARAREIAKDHGGNFRAPHHTVSGAGMAGELALAAGGVLYLDEANEFSRSSISTIKNLVPMMDSKVRPLLIVGIRWQHDPFSKEKAPEDVVERALDRTADMFQGWDVAEHFQGKS